MPNQPHLLQQAPVQALDPDGTVVLVLGTAAFAVASLALGLAWPALVAQDSQWWLWVALTGTAIGVLGLWYALWRRGRRRRGRSTRLRD